MKCYIVDAFSDKVFSGNPAAVCILDKWLPDTLMENIAGENNLSETAFAVKEGEIYHLRWFTLAGEIDLCGHATLACAYVVLNYIEKDWDSVIFTTLSGNLTVTRKGEIYEMDFPSYHLKQIEATKEIADAIGIMPKAVYIGRDLLCVLEDEQEIRNITPDLEKVKALDGLLLHVTAKGESTDCVSRTFSPKCNFPEDPVCGSGHCHIVPYWTKRLKKEKIIAYQASKRGGMLYCSIAEDRVKLGGKAALYAISELFIEK